MNTSIIIFIIFIFIINSLSIVESFVPMGRVAARPALSHVKVINKDNSITKDTMTNEAMKNDAMKNDATNNNNDNSLLILFYVIISIPIGYCVHDMITTIIL